MTKALKPPLIFVVAGEHSGDALGVNLMQALKTLSNGQLNFAGVGGPKMTSEGLNSLFPMEQLSVMGVFEVLPKLPLLLKRIKETANEVEKLKPDVLVTIDAPDFSFRVIKILRKRGVKVPIIHYVAPSVWAWRPGRAKKVAAFLDHLLCVLPFEPPYFEKEGLNATFVGHPVVESSFGQADGHAFRKRHNLPLKVPLMCVLPGSRNGEIERLMPVFGDAISKLAPQFQDLTVVLPTVDHVKARVLEFSKNWAVPVIVVNGEEKAEAFKASNAALAASGTVALELAMAGLVNVIGYRFQTMTGFLLKYLIKTPYANLVNVILGREAIAEFIQDECTAENLSFELARLLDDEEARKAQLLAAQEALTELGLGGEAPGMRAAQVVMEMISQETSP